MHLHLPHGDRLSETTRTAREAFWVAAICFVALFAFFMVIGSVSPGAAGVATAIFAVLALGRRARPARHPGARTPRFLRIDFVDPSSANSVRAAAASRQEF